MRVYPKVTGLIWQRSTRLQQ